MMMTAPFCRPGNHFSPPRQQTSQLGVADGEGPAGGLLARAKTELRGVPGRGKMKPTGGGSIGRTTFALPGLAQRAGDVADSQELPSGDEERWVRAAQDGDRGAFAR